MEDHLNTDQLVAEHLRIDCADCHLYRIGLSLYEPASFEAGIRKVWHHPIIVFLCAAQLFVYQTVIVFLPERDNRFHLYFGDIGHLVNGRIPLALACALVGLLAVYSQLCKYYNYRYGILPTDLHMFQMMVGRVTPKSIGLNDSRSVMKLLKTSKRILFVTKIISPSVKYCIFLIVLTVITTRVAEADLLIAIPYAMVWPTLAQYCFNIIIYQFVYYYLITYYLHLKLKLFNQKLRHVLVRCHSRKVAINVAAILHESHAIYCEIDDCDRRYWSKFLAVLWMAMSIEVASMSYMTFFGNSVLVLKILFGCVTSLFAFILIFVISISSAVYKEANNSYALYNSMFRLIEANIRIKIKFSSLIQLVGKEDIGFHCWKFFIINNHRGYEAFEIQLT